MIMQLSELQQAMLHAVGQVAVYFGETEGEIKEWLDGGIREWKGIRLNSIEHAANTRADFFGTLAVVTLGMYAPDHWTTPCIEWLHSSNPWTRWGALIFLGYQHHPQALRPLCEALVEQSLSPDLVESGSDVLFLFWARHIPGQLSRYQDLQVVPSLLTALANVEHFRQVHGPPIPPLAYCEEMASFLVDALGRLHQWQALDAIPFPPAERPLWQMHLVGAAMRDEVQEAVPFAVGALPYDWNDMPVLCQRIQRELAQHYGWSEDEIAQTLLRYERTKLFRILFAFYAHPQDMANY
jgi:hypothetical protein